MAEESQDIENGIILAISVITSVIVSQWLHVGFDIVGDTIYVRHFGTAFFLSVSLGVSLHIKNYPVQIIRNIFLFLALWSVIFIGINKLPSITPVFALLSWTACNVFYIVLIKSILKVDFRSTVWLSSLICASSLVFTMMNYSVTTFVWLIGMAIIPMFAKSYVSKLSDK